MLSAFIEIVQYVFALEATDVDDIILNLMGGFIGLMMYKIAEKPFKDNIKIKKAMSILSLIVGLPIFVLFILLIVAN